LAAALDYLSRVQSIDEPEKAVKRLYAIYRKIDHFDESLTPSQRQFFPDRYEERTMEKFLPIVSTIYEILRDASERYIRAEQFQAFWFTCWQYLKKIGYDGRSFMNEAPTGDEGLFHRQSFGYWRREFKDSPAGLETMMLWFKACFGIIGNEDYCCVQEFPVRTFDWNRMLECHAAFSIPPSGISALPPPSDYPEWDDETRQKFQEAKARLKERSEEDTDEGQRLIGLIRERIDLYRQKDNVNEEEAHRFLEAIRERNRERGIFQE
jgi:hypothetical protein